MTTQPTNDPIPPFRVKSELLQGANDSAAQGSGQRPPRAGGNGNGWGESRPFPGFDWTWTHVLAAPLLAAIYFVTQQRPEFAPVAILVLLGATLYRLDAAKRRIAFAPVALAALRLMGNLSAAGMLCAQPVNYAARSAALTVAYSGVSWLPLFFATCLIYMPKHPSATGKIFLTTATLLLTSGLLPAEGSLGIFATCQYFVFIGVVVGLILDFSGHHYVRPHDNFPAGAPPVGAAPLGATR
jgi:hypothetical protein